MIGQAYILSNQATSFPFNKWSTLRIGIYLDPNYTTGDLNPKIHEVTPPIVTLVASGREAAKAEVCRLIDQAFNTRIAKEEEEHGIQMANRIATKIRANLSAIPSAIPKDTKEPAEATAQPANEGDAPRQDDFTPPATTPATLKVPVTPPKDDDESPVPF